MKLAAVNLTAMRRAGAWPVRLGALATLAACVFLASFEISYVLSMHWRGFGPWQLWDFRFYESPALGFALATGLAFVVWATMHRAVANSKAVGTRGFLRQAAAVMIGAAIVCAAIGGYSLASIELGDWPTPEQVFLVLPTAGAAFVIVSRIDFLVIDDSVRLRAFRRSAAQDDARTVICPECGAANGARATAVRLRVRHRRWIVWTVVGLCALAVPLIGSSMVWIGFSSVSFVVPLVNEPALATSPAWSPPTTWRRLSPAEAFGPPRTSLLGEGELTAMMQFGWPFCWLRLDYLAMGEPTDWPQGVLLQETKLGKVHFRVVPFALNLLSVLCVLAVLAACAACIWRRLAMVRVSRLARGECVKCRYELGCALR